MTWDASTPQGSEAVSLGDDRIRELKTDLEAALTIEHDFPIDTSAPGLIYTPDRGNTASRPSGTYLVTGRLYINTETKAIERYNGSTWDNVDTVPGAATVTETMLATSVAGDGLTGGAGTALSVVVDNATLEINTDTVRVKDLGITTAKINDLAVTTGKIAAAAVDENKLAASVAGNGLAGGAGTALSVNVDGSTLEINSDSLRVKDAGVTEAKLASAVVVKLGQNIGLVAIVESASNGTLLSYSGQGRLRGITSVGGTATGFALTIDGVAVDCPTTIGSGEGLKWGTNSGGTPIVSDAAALLDSLDIHFKTSILVSKTGGAGTVSIAYERQA